MGNKLFSQPKPQEKIPTDIVRKARDAFSIRHLGEDPNISSVGTQTENGETSIQVGVVEKSKSNIPTHFQYICPNSRKKYAVPVKVTLVGKIQAHKTGPRS